jgi:F-type H+-transporting ATPase subunit delta
MGSATREALASSKAALAALGSRADLATAEDLFAAGRVIGDSASLRAALADPSAEAAAKASIVDRIFGQAIGAEAAQLIETITAKRWSGQDDLLSAIEDLGIRAIATSAPASVSIETELLTFGQAVASDSELELALGNKLGDTDSKVALVDRLLVGKAAEGTVAIVRHLIAQPRGRRIRKLIAHAISVVADAAGLAIATVTSAAPITGAQQQRLEQKLASLYGRRLQLNNVIDPTMIGGLHVQIGDDVIDGSIASRINDLKLQLQH